MIPTLSESLILDSEAPRSPDSRFRGRPKNHRGEPSGWWSWCMRESSIALRAHASALRDRNRRTRYVYVRVGVKLHADAAAWCMLCTPSASPIRQSPISILPVQLTRDVQLFAYSTSPRPSVLGPRLQRLHHPTMVLYGTDYHIDMGLQPNKKRLDP